MSKFLTLVRDFFTALFSGGKKEAKKRRELKELNRELRGNRHRYYKSHSNEVLPTFAHAVYKFAQYARLLRDLFERTILNENAKQADMYKDYLVEERLDDENRFKKLEFTAKAMRERCAGVPHFSAAMEEITREFTAYLELFKQPQFQNFDREYTELERLAMISRYDFEKLLAFFDPRIRVTPSARKPSFVAAPGKHMTQDLMDFYFVMSGLNFDPQLTHNVALLLVRIRGGRDEQEIQKIDKILSGMASVRHNFLPNNILLSLLKSVNEDPSFSIPPDREQFQYLELYKARILSRFELEKEKLLREQSEKAVEHSLADLFGTNKLMSSDGLPEELSEELALEGYHGFSNVRPFQILKTFVVVIFEKKIKDHVKRLVIDAFFENKQFKDRFISLFHDLQEAYDQIASFEDTMTEPGEVSLHTVREYLQKQYAGKVVSASLSKLVETINANTAHMVEEISNSFASFNLALIELLADAKQHSPLIISNIKVIGGDRNAEFLSALVDDQRAIGRFIEVMRHFTVIHKELRKEEGTRQS
ncbi:MAG TPA: hypothetical protein ENN69_02685 [Spirochaetia bacterium]|nr:hypothetical protein [Spirochaetia bacterium]